MLRGLFLRAVDVKNLGLELGFAYPLQRLQVMAGLTQMWSQAGSTAHQLCECRHVTYLPAPQLLGLTIPTPQDCCSVKPSTQ